MLRLFLIMVLSGSVYLVDAQIVVHAENPDVDTLEMVFYKDDWVIRHTLAKGEDIFVLSRRYHVPPALLADLNGINFQTSLTPGSLLYIPFGAYNRAKGASADRFDTRPLYYVVRKYDNLFRLAHLAGVQQKQLQEWNGMSDNYIEEGQRLFVGWVLYEVAGGAAAPPVAGGNRTNTSGEGTRAGGVKAGKQRTRKNSKGETVVEISTGNIYDTLPEIEKAYMAQTKKEAVVTEEKGTAVFFDNKGKLNSNTTFFAFHNTASPGTIIKVYNPGTDRTVFVKVLGPIPNTKQYHNSLIGISSGAKEKLMVAEDRAWCELKFAPSK